MMKEKSEEEKLKQKVEEITPEKPTARVTKKTATSLIDEARELKEANEKLVAEMKEERMKLEELRAHDVLAGKSLVEPKQNQGDKDQQEAKDIIDMFR